MRHSKRTLGNMFLKRVNLSPSRNAIGWIDHGELKFFNFGDYKNIVSNACCGIHFTMQPEWKVAIWAATRKEWHIMDIASMFCSKVVVPVYPSLSMDEIVYILNHSEADCLYIESKEQLQKLIKVADKLEHLQHIVCPFELSGEDLPWGFNSFRELLEIGASAQKKSPNLFNQLIDSIDEESAATIIYTSGTTGVPKGAVITHSAIFYMLQNITKSTNGTFSQRDRSLIFLPLSHVFGRMDSFLAINFGLTMFFFSKIDEAFESINQVNPTIFLTVPRVLEKIKEQFIHILENKNIITKNLYNLSIRRGEKYFSELRNKDDISIFEKLERELYYNLIFKHIKEYLGGNLRFIVSGGAPLRSDLFSFFRDANITILEGYGLTETIAPCTLNPVNKQIVGSVGKPMGDVKISFGEDSEIYIKSKAIFSGYYKDPEGTKEAFSNGWFKTGDIGMIIEDGYLKITDRKKDIIVTSTGKNIAPQKVEAAIKEDHLFANSIVIGNNRNYLTALLFIDRDYVVASSQKFKLSESPSFDEISRNKIILSEVDKRIEAINEKLARFEQIKKYKIMPFQLGIHNYLTPSLKIKKKVLISDYKELINTMY